MSNKSCGEMLYVMLGIAMICVLCIIYKCLPLYHNKENIDKDIKNEKKAVGEVNGTINKAKGNIINLRSGYYKPGTELIFTVEEGTCVYYTIDGSQPSIGASNTFCLEESVSLKFKDVSDNPNVYSGRSDSSLAYEEYMHYAGLDSAVFAIPDEAVDKCNVIRAIAVDAENNIVEEQIEVYFIGFEEKQGYENMKTVSLVVEPDDFWGYEKGINVLGKSFDEADKGALFAQYGKAYSFYSANYRNVGQEWEREARIFIFDENHELLEDKDIGIRAKGNGSRGTAQKSFNIFARKKYDENDVFSEKLFISGKKCESITLFNGGAFSQDKLKDVLTSEFAGNLEFATIEYEPSVLFINGEYWGMYYISERIDDRYIENHYNIDKNNVIIVKNDAIHEGLSEDLNFYLDMVDYISNNDMSVEKNWRGACNLIDMSSFIDYYAYEIYIDNADWPGNNVALWRVKNITEDEYCDGKWRYILFDTDASFGNRNIEDMIAIVSERDKVFSSLYNNEKFRKMLFTRLQDIVNICFEERVVQQYINEYQIEKKDIVNKSIRRWYYDKNTVNFFEDVRKVLYFFQRRSDSVRDFFTDFYKNSNISEEGMERSQVPGENSREFAYICVSFAGTGKNNSILLNGLEIKGREEVWMGEYLLGTELELNIPSNVSKNFVGWKLEGAEDMVSDTSYNFVLRDALYVEAVFR